MVLPLASFRVQLGRRRARIDHLAIAARARLTVGAAELQSRVPPRHQLDERAGVNRAKDPDSEPARFHGGGMVPTYPVVVLRALPVSRNADV